jgi:hypothetical protein
MQCPIGEMTNVEIRMSKERQKSRDRK